MKFCLILVLALTLTSATHFWYNPILDLGLRTHYLKLKNNFQFLSFIAFSVEHLINTLSSTPGVRQVCDVDHLLAPTGNLITLSTGLEVSTSVTKSFYANQANFLKNTRKIKQFLESQLFCIYQNF